MITIDTIVQWWHSFFPKENVENPVSQIKRNNTYKRYDEGYDDTAIQAINLIRNLDIKETSLNRIGSTEAVPAASSSKAKGNRGITKYFDITPLNLDVPKEIWDLILFQIDCPKLLARMRRVCKQWDLLINEKKHWQKFNLNQLFPIPNRIFLRKEWEEFILPKDWKELGLSIEFEDIELDHRALIAELYKRCILSEKNEFVINTHSLILIPKGLSLNDFIKTDFFPLSPLQIAFFAAVSKKYGDQKIEKTHLALIANTTIEKTKNKLLKDQIEIIEQYNNKISVETKNISPFSEYRLPKFLHALTLNFMHFKQTNVRLFPEEPLTYTRAEEAPFENKVFSVGNFSKDGIAVWLHSKNEAKKAIGVAPVKVYYPTINE